MTGTGTRYAILWLVKHDNGTTSKVIDSESYHFATDAHIEALNIKSTLHCTSDHGTIDFEVIPVSAQRT